MEKLEKIIVEEILGKDASLSFNLGKISKTFLEKYCKIIKLLSSSYVENKKDEITKKMQSTEVAKAYALYYLPINFYKISYLLDILKGEFEVRKDVDFLDYGSGPATGALSFCNIKNDANITLYDTSSEMLKIGEKILKKYQNPKKLILSSEKKEILNKKYDVITFLNTINEFQEDEKIFLINNLKNILKEGGIAIIIEPALKEASRKLMDFRNQILKEKDFKVLYPCFHSNECKMLESEKDWCHQELKNFNSRLVSQIDDITGFNKHKIKFSSLVLKKTSQDIKMDNFFRVVNIPKLKKDGIEFLLCGVDFYGEKKVPKKELKEKSFLKKVNFFDKIEKF